MALRNHLLQVVAFLGAQRDDILLDHALFRSHRIDRPPMMAIIDSTKQHIVNDEGD
jgi:hypothetical protein